MAERGAIEAALSAVEASCGLRGQVDGDGVTLSWHGRAHHFRVEHRASLRPVHVPLVREGLQQGNDAGPALLITRHVGPQLADQLRRGGVPFLDESGNAWVESPDWAVLVTGRTATVERAPRPSISKTMWQVAYVLLRGDAEACTVRQLAQRAGVSHGTAANALVAFEGHGWIDRFRVKQHLLDPEGLLGAWEFGYADRLQASIDLGLAVAPGARTLAAWAEAIGEQLGSEHGVLGGELAAERMGTDILAATATLHVPRWDAETMRALRVVPAQQGPIGLRRVFGTCTSWAERPELADPLLVRAEVLMIDDDRLDATRAALRERIVARWRR